MAKQAEHGITWTEETWNPIRGCSRVSEGCRNCYAERIAHRFSGAGEVYEGLVRIANGHPQWTGEVRVVEEHMLDPLRWTRPRRIFVNSMSDLFHENVSDETIALVFGVMGHAPQHTFQVLTKRPQRMLDWITTEERVVQAYDSLVDSRMFDDDSDADRVICRGQERITKYDRARGFNYFDFKWPMPNVWLGVSVENQAAADERIPLLLQTPAAVRWVSAEPLLGGIDLGIGAAKGLPIYPARHASLTGEGRSTQNPWYRDVTNWARSNPWLDWVVVGGESGHGARPMQEAWARSLRDQCVAAGVAFHFKQWGEWLPAMCDGAPGDFQELNCSDSPARVGKRKAGRLLDGRTWDEYPEARA